jgi:hypothetical protein
MIDYSNIYVVVKAKASLSKKWGSRSLSNGSTIFPKCNTIFTTRGEMRSISMVSRGCALQLVNSLSSHDLDFQQKVLEKMLQHKLVKPMLPTSLSNIGETKSNHLIVQSIKSSVSTHLANGRSSKHCATKELLGTLASTKFATGRKVAKNLGLDRQCQ